MNKYLIFFTLIALSITFTFLSNHFLLSENIYFDAFAEQFSFEQIEEIIFEASKWKWVGYAFIPVFIVFKITLVTCCLSIGLYFVINQFNFNELFKIALLAELIFLIPSLLKIIWFAFFQTDYNLLDLQLFYPLSALSLFDETAVQQNQSWLVYPLQTLNLFEVAYWLLLAKGVSEVIKKDFTKSFELVMASYGTGLVLWVVTIMFITVTYGA